MAVDTTFTYSVNNVAPVLNSLTITPSINENDVATLTGTFADPGVHDAHTVTVDWDDANAPADSTFALPAISTLAVGQTYNSSSDGAVLEITSVDATTGVVGFEVAHQYLDDGAAPGNVTNQDDAAVMVTVVDDDGDSGVSTISTVTVHNVSPSFDAGANVLFETPATFTRYGIAFTDPGTLDVHTVTVDYNGDGTIDQTINVPVGQRTFDLSHTYAAPGIFTVSVTISDDDGGTQTDTFQVTVLDPLLVTTVSDVVANDGVRSLREAMLYANANPGLDTIRFNIAGGGVRTINVGSTGLGALPAITESVIIDATTQPGFTGTPMIELNGTSAGAGVHGLTITASGSTIRGLAINRFQGSGIVISGTGATGNVVAGNFIGTNAAGTAALGNSSRGIYILDGAGNNIIGGTVAADRNVISGNTSVGVRIDGPASTGNVITGNYIGMDAAGTSAIANATYGIIVDGAPDTTIGGSASGAGNLVSGNTQGGIAIVGSTATGALVEGNRIGTDISGTLDRGNAFSGIRLGTVTGFIDLSSTGSSSQSIIRGNLISGNNEYGIRIRGAGADQHLIVGNLIGTNAAGTAAIANTLFGIRIDSGASNNTIGGVTAADRNVISGNVQHGVGICENSTSGNVVAGNYIGTNAAGTAAVANGWSGVAVSAAVNNRIGSNGDGVNDADERNVISGNAFHGVHVADLATANMVAGNYIGTNAAGTAAIANANNGILIDAGASNNTIGGTSAGAGNIISGNDLHGVAITNEGTDSNVVAGNYIGTDATGTADLGNGWSGVVIAGGAVSNTIGGTSAGSRNIISGNQLDGIHITGNNTTGNIVSGNYIGTDVTGTVRIGNAWKGVRISGGAKNNTVGGSTAGARNIISGNFEDGVAIHDAGTDSNTVAGNYIGTNATGTADLGNGWSGVNISGGAKSNTIGGTTVAARNIISGNDHHGVGIGNSGTDNNVVAGNYIGTNVTGTADLGNAFHGVVVYSGAKNNTVGGVTASSRNIISGNDHYGVGIFNAGTDNNVVAGNYVGLDVTGTADLGNSLWGVAIYDGAKSNTIGGTTTGARNIISGNDEYGVGIGNSGTDNNVVAGNYIGTDLTGTIDLGNAWFGVIIYDGGKNNTVGGTTAGAGNVISGNDHHGVGIRDSGTDNNVVTGNYIGTNVTGTADLGNALHGVVVYSGAKNNRVGGTAASSRNIISGNNWSGIAIEGAGTSGTLVQGNYIGTNLAGSADLGNSGYGVAIYASASSNTIGGTTAGARNIISGNDHHGVGIFNAGTDNNVVAGNYVGLDVAGTADLGNALGGVAIYDSAKSNTIGGTTAGARNIISGNDEYGVGIGGSGTDGNVIAGNYIGTNASGTANVGNALAGVVVSGGAQNNTIGGAGATGNVISGNSHGIVIGGAGTDNNTVAANYVGTDWTGTGSLGNSLHGIIIISGAKSNLIGTDADGVNDAAERNVISGNALNGIEIYDSGTTNNTVAGNYIGTDVTGTADLGNGWSGISIYLSATNNTIGGAIAAARNIISGNDLGGVGIGGAGTNNNTVVGNFIGTDVSGAVDLGNAGSGLVIHNGASNNTIGGISSGERNLISGNAGHGVAILNAGTDSNVIIGNYIGTDVTGTAALGNDLFGVAVYDGAADNTIGGTAAGAGNLISCNSQNGVGILGSGTSGNTVAGNLIGTDITGTADLGNLGWGVVIYAGASDNRVGGSSASARNIISGNDGHGVAIFNAGTDRNTVAGNYIGTDVTGTVGLGNAFWGVVIFDGAKSNTIGGSTAGERNIISGNAGHGVALGNSGTESNVVAGNYIGTDVTGMIDLGNAASGVAIYGGAKNNTIGGTADAGNLISGNAWHGVQVSDAGTDSNVIAGNYIGTDATGTADLGNAFHGVVIYAGAKSNMVGGSASGVGNLISGNDGNGVVVAESGTENNVVAGNFIGSDVTGSAGLGNAFTGVAVYSGAANNTIGGVAPGAGNLISGNLGHGVAVANSGTDNNVVAGNFIGTDVSGTIALGNAIWGVLVFNGAKQNTIGGSAAGARNLISGNVGYGVAVFDPGTEGNIIAGNFIGTDASGAASLGNTASGVVVSNGATNNIIGDASAGAGNVISGNIGHGVEVLDATTTGNIIRANSIHSNVGLGIDLGGDGVTATTPATRTPAPTRC